MVHFLEGCTAGVLIGGAFVFWWAHRDPVDFKRTDEELAALANRAKRK